MKKTTGQHSLFSVPQQEKIIGHEAIRHFFDRAVKSDRLAHAFLFVGPEHVGKMTIARDFATTLLGTETLEKHPDFFLVERERDAKTGKLHGTIVLEQINALCSKLALGAFLRGWKVCVLDGADCLTTESANALLKTLEEPHPKTLLILLASSFEQVLPTIRSRCQLMRFTRVSTNRIKDALVERGTALEQAKLWSRLSGGNPGRALMFFENPEMLNEMFDWRNILFSFTDSAIADRWSGLESILPKKLSFQESVDRATQVLDLLVELLRDAMMLGQGREDQIVHVDSRTSLDAWLGNLGLQKIMMVLEEVKTARRFLDANVNPRSVLDYVAACF